VIFVMGVFPGFHQPRVAVKTSTMLTLPFIAS